jgi:peptide/nickel transport system substrate-binding protein
MSLVTAGLLLLAGCSPSAPAQTTPEPLSAPPLTGQPTSAPAVPAPTLTLGASQPKSGGRVVVGDIADVKTLNPVLVSDPASDVVTSRMFAGLVSVDARSGAVGPELAEKFEIAQDGKSLVFQMRDGLKFSDGSPLSGDDFKFTVMATLRSKKSAHKSAVEQILGAREFEDGTSDDVVGITGDGNTLMVQLTNAFCPALTQIGTLQILPKSVFGKYIDANDVSKNLDDAPENAAPPIGSGPFAYKEWVANDHVTLVRNDNFWHKANLDEWVHKAYASEETLLTAVKAGDVDIAQVDGRELQDVQSSGDVQVFKYLNPAYTYIGWNQLRGGKEFFQDKSVRQALAYGLDVQQFIETQLSGQGVKMVAQVLPTSWAYDASGLNTYDYSPSKAEQLLQDDGWSKGDDGVYAKDGQRLAFSIVTNASNPLREAFVQMAADQYKQLGIDAQAKTEPLDALLQRFLKSQDSVYGDQGGRDFDAIVIGWSLNSDPDMYSVWDSNSTHPGENNAIQYKNADLDKAIAESRTHCGADERKDTLKRANQILNEEQPYNFGFATNALLVVSKRVQGVVPGSYARLGQARPETWWVQ